MNKLSQQNAVVIGGGSGVGRGICLALSGEGVKVVVADLDITSANNVKDAIIANNGKALAVQVDSTKPDSLEELAIQATREFQNIDILVNTVGVILERKLEDISVDDWCWIWKLNVLSQIESVNAFLPYLRESKNSHIILTVSGAGLVAPSLELKIGAYSTTKHALVGYAKNLRNELQDEGINVTLLCPSGVEGNLATTSANNYQHFTGKNIANYGGKQPADKKLEDSTVIGKTAVDAIKSKVFFASNKKSLILRAIDDERTIFS